MIGTRKFDRVLDRPDPRVTHGGRLGLHEGHTRVLTSQDPSGPAPRKEEGPVSQEQSDRQTYPTRDTVTLTRGLRKDWSRVTHLNRTCTFTGRRTETMGDTLGATFTESGARECPDL